MAITYTEEQRELVKLVRDVARNEVMPYVAAATNSFHLFAQFCFTVFVHFK